MRTLAFFALNVFLAGWAAAQPAVICPPSPSTTCLTQTPAPIPDLQKYLNLSDTQVASLESIAQAQQQAVTQLYQQISAKEAALQNLLQAANPDPLAIGQATIDIQNLQKQISQLGITQYQSQALAVLTQAQVAQLANLKTALQLQSTAYQAASVFLIAGSGGTIVPYVLQSSAIGAAAPAAK